MALGPSVDSQSQRKSIHAGFRWRKIMSKTEDASKVRELQDDELDGVTGGLVVNAIIAILIGLLLPSDAPTGGKPGIGPV
jgi:hypothetical protein